MYTKHRDIRLMSSGFVWVSTSRIISQPIIIHPMKKALIYKHTQWNHPSNSIPRTPSQRRPPRKRVIPLFPPHTLLQVRSGLLPLLIQHQIPPIPTLANDVNLDILLDIRIETAAPINIITRPRLAPVFHIVQLHHPDYTFLALAESDIRHGVRARSFGAVVARVVSVGYQAFGAVGRVSVFVRGAHRGQEVADAGAEDDG